MDRVVEPMIRLEGGIWGMAVEYEKGKRQDSTMTRKNLPCAGMGFLVNQGLQTSPWLLLHDRTWQGWVSGSGRACLRRAGRPITVG